MPRLPPRPARRASLVAGAAVLVAAATGCSGGGDQPTAEPSSPMAGDQRNAPTQVEADGLPVDFPREEVPVVDGDIVSVQEPTVESGAYNLLVHVGDTPRRAIVEQAVGELQDAGWSLATGIEGEPPAAQLLTKPGGVTQRVILTNSSQGEESAIGYTVEVQK